MPLKSQILPCKSMSNIIVMLSIACVERGPSRAINYRLHTKPATLHKEIAAVTFMLVVFITRRSCTNATYNASLLHRNIQKAHQDSGKNTHASCIYTIFAYPGV